MNKKVKTKISTLFMLVVLLAQTLTPVVTVFAEDTTSTQASSEVQTFNESTSQVQVGQGGTTVSSAVPVVPDSTPPSTTASSEVIASSEVTNESPTSESQEVAATEEAAEEDEEPASDSIEKIFSTSEQKLIQAQSLEMDQILSFLIGAELTVKYTDGTSEAITGDKEIDPALIQSVFLSYSFDLGSEIDNPLEAGAYQFKLPPVLSGTTLSGDISNVEGGTFTIAKDGTVTLNLTESFFDQDERLFTVKIGIGLNKELFEEKRHQPIEIGVGDEKIIDFDLTGKDKNYEGKDEKSGKTYILDETGEKVSTDFNATHADWVVRVNDQMNKYDVAGVIDTLEGGHKLVQDSVKVYLIHRNPKGKEISRVLVPPKSLETTDTGFNLDLGPIYDTYEIHYTTKIEPGEAGKTTKIKNKAQITLGGDSNTLEEPLEVTWGEDFPIIEKKYDGQEGQKLKWQIDYNFGNEKLGYPLDLSDTVKNSHFDIDNLDLKVQEVTLNSQGELVYGKYVDASDLKITIDENNPSKLSIKYPNAKDGMGYRITYQSIVKGGLENTEVKNEVTDNNNPENNNASSGTTVTTKPGITKNGQVKSDKGQAYIEWTIKVNDPSFAFDSLLVTDRFSSKDLDLDLGSVKLDGNPINVKPFKEGDLAGFDYEITPVEAKPYILTYRTNVTDEGLKQDKLVNKGDVSWADGIGTGATGEVPGIQPGITKSGKYIPNTDGTKELIDWTLVFNTNHLILNVGTTITDVMTPDDLRLVGEPLITEQGTDRVLVKHVDYKFEDKDNGFVIELLKPTIDKQYTIKYQTNTPKGNVVANNSATLDWQGKNQSVNSKPMPVRIPSVEKTNKVVGKGEDRQIEWTVTFNSNKHIIENLILTDTFTPADSKFVAGSLDITAGGRPLAKEEYVFNAVSENKFTIKFDKPTEPVQYVMTYRTTYPKEAEHTAVVNTVDLTFTGGRNTASSRVDKPELKVEKKGTINKEKQTITWTITANGGQAVTLKDAFLSDTIQADQEYVPGTMTLNGATIDDSSDGRWTDKTFKVDLPNGKSTHTVVYETKIVSYPSVSGDATYKNKVDLTNWPGDSLREAKDDHEASVSYFKGNENNNPSKTGSQNEETDSIEWEVTVNPEGLPIKEATIKDSLTGSHQYKQETIELFIGDTQLKKGEDYELTVPENGKNFTIELLDRTEAPGEIKGGISHTYRLKYQTVLDDDFVGQENVKNKVGVFNESIGFIDEVITTETTTEKWYFGASGSGTKLQLVGTKVDKDNPSLKLSDIKFRLDRVTTKGTTEIGKYTSDSNGEISLKDIRSARYILTELEPKAGYAQIAPIYFILGKKDGKTTVTLTDDNWKPSGSSNVIVGNPGEITITNEKVKKSVTANKVWAGEGLTVKPTIWFTLYHQAGEDSNPHQVKGTEIKKLENGTTSVTWTGLPTHNDDGKEYTYFVKETDAEGKVFTPDYYSKKEDGLTVTNTFKQKDVEVKFNKVWKDFDNAHKTRPNQIYIQLLQNNNPYGKVVTLPLPGTVGYWGYTFTKLPEINPSTGEKYRYSVVETDENGQVVEEIEGNNGNIYDVEIDTIDPEGNTTISNTLRNKTSVSGEKIWSGEGGYEEFARPDSITVELYDGFTKIRETKVSQGTDGKWGYKFENLPKYDAERLIAYTVKEVTVPGYDTSITDTTITNTLKTTEISAKKVWDDDSDQSSRPDSITFELLAQVEGVSGVIAIDERKLEKPAGNPDTWSYTFENLPTHNKEGKKFIYTIREKTVPDGSYATSETEIVDGVYQITNTLIAEDELIIKKVWEDQTDTSSRPAFIEVQLYRQVDGKDKEKVGEPRKLTPKDELNPLDWQIKFTGLAASDKEGNKYNYFVEEVTDSASYLEPKISKEGQVSTITNTLDSVNIPVEKIWDDSTDLSLRPDSVTVDLYRQIEGEDTATKVEGHSLTLSEADSWKGQFTGLAKEDKSGNAYIYSVKEQEVKGYTPTVVPGLKDGFVITNKLDLTEVSVTKVWDDFSNKYGLRPESIELSLMVKQGEQLVPVTKKVKNSEGQIVEEEVKLTLSGDMTATEWTGKFENLTKFDYAGQLVQYYVLETAIKAYKEVSVQKVNDKQQVSITNELRKTEIPVIKTWLDEEDYFGLRPESIKVSLYQNGKAFDKVAPFDITPDKDGNWSHTFADLPEVDAEGNAYEYTIFESTVHGYEGTINQNTGEITNSLVTVDVPVTKVWEDTFHEEADYYNLRPDSITVRLLQNGKEIAQVPAAKVGDKDGSWSHVFKDLPKFDKTGTLYEYTVTEDEDPRYKTEISGGVITNTLKTTEIPVTKTWSDEEDYFGLRPESIKVSLYQNGKAFDKVAPFDITPDKDGNWTHTFTDLPEVDAEGNAYEYTIFESTVHGYEGTINQETGEITNSLVTVDVPVTKVWEDTFHEEADYYNLRPDSITVRLLQNGKEIAQVPAVKVVDKDGSWNHVFKDLPKFDKTGKPYEYTITEDEDPRYKTEIQNGVITNTLKTTEVPVIKTWLDENNRFGLRPEEITVSLYQNDKLFEAVAPFVIKADKDGNWTHTFTDLPEIDAEGNAYEYKIFESEVTGYEGTIDQKTGKITNSLVTIDIPVTKVWEDTFKGKENYYQSRPESITIRLKQNGKEIAQVPAVKVVDKDGNWSHVFKDLPKLDKDGEAYEYEVTEDTVDKYNTKIDVNESNEVTITNTRKTYAIGDYTWIDTDKDGVQDPDEKPLVGVIVELFDEKGNPILDKDGKPMTTTTDKNGRYIFDELEDGKYTIKFTLTKEQSEKYEFTKQDAGENDKSDSDADELTGWTTTITLNDDSNELTKDYEIQDFKATEGIDPTWDAGVVLREKIEVTGTKVWVGGPKVKPTIELQLYRNGKAFGDPVELKDGTTTYTWKDLYETDTNKEPYVYTVQEVGIPSEYNKTEEGLKVTNTRKTYAIGDYTWIDTDKDGIQDKNEPVLPGVKVELFDENGKKIAETTTDKNGRYIFDELESGKYKVKFTLTDEQKKLYKFTKRHSGDVAKDSNADDEGWTIDIDLNENNAFLTLDYTDQTFKASEGIDPTWDAGVILLDVPVKPTDPKDPKPELPQMGEAGNPFLLTSLGILLIGSVVGVVTTRRRRQG